MPSQNRSSPIQRMTLFLLPVVAGVGAALLLLLLAGGPADLAYAGTLTYPGCGATIQDCINAANPGDTILIQAGDYTESLTLRKAVSLTGDLSSTTILHALPMARVLTIDGAAVDSSVVISGLTFTGGNLPGFVRSIASLARRSWSAAHSLSELALQFEWWRAVYGRT